MELGLKILSMYGIAFCISMLVAFFIWLIKQLIHGGKVRRYISPSIYEELKRLGQIRRVRRRKARKVLVSKV